MMATASPIGAVGEVEAAQPVVGGGEPDPGLGVARMAFDRAAEIALGEAEIAGPELLLAEREVVARIAAEQARHPAAARRSSRWRRDRRRLAEASEEVASSGLWKKSPSLVDVSQPPRKTRHASAMTDRPLTPLIQPAPRAAARSIGAGRKPARAQPRDRLGPQPLRAKLGQDG